MARPPARLITSTWTKPGHMWCCRDCNFVAMDITTAAIHTELIESMSHWLFEHPDGDRSKPASRQMHGSDQGWPPYISEWPYRQTDA